jgi:tRNA modification GTPase
VRAAQVALVIVDARDGGEHSQAADDAIVAALPPDQPRVIVHNKIDLAGVPPRFASHAGDGNDPARWHVWLSAKTGAGLDALDRALREAIGAGEELETVFLARARHVAALVTAARHVAAAEREVSAAEPALELFAEELREAHRALGEIVGITTADDLLGAIFARFCIGK